MRYAAILSTALASLVLGGCVYIASDETDTDKPHRMGAERSAPHMEMGEHASAMATSDASFAVTKVRLRNAITARGLTLFDEIDHQANAEAAGLVMAPSTVFIFGNPNAGSALMNADPKLGMALPLRAHIYEVDGVTNVHTSNIEMMAHHHDLSSVETVTDNIKATLVDIRSDATGGE